ncbi:MAG: T9SS C-terminal target domain-containing protein [Calditrichaeota bacterium]|nr:MAG: T9SS C-terminal target domain-containing protein [Calditrichota bacterium]
MKNLATSLLTLSLGFAITSSSFAEKVYWVDDSADKIQRANLDGSNVEDLVTSGLSSPRGLALDLTNSKMYWSDAGTNKIQRANLDGTNVEDVIFEVPRSPSAPKETNKISTFTTNPLGIALDESKSKIYWTDSFLNYIRRENTDATNPELLVSGLDDPEGIALDLANSKMYWSDGFVNKIQRADLDGTNVEDVVTGLNGPSDVTLDLTNLKVYWTSFGDSKIKRANLDGSNVEDVVVGVVQSFSVRLDLTNSKVYWTEHLSGKVRRANLDGSNIEDIVNTAGDLFELALDLTPDAPLSVELDSFKARQIGRTIGLSWATASETENAGFNVYRKIGNNDFVQISSYENNSELIGTLNTSTASFYTFVDNSEFKNNELYTYYVSDVETNGTETKHTELAQSVVYEIKSQVVDRFQLKQNFPNPFNPSTTISYNLGDNVDVSLKIYNEKGEFVKELVNENQSKGSHSIDWNGTDSFGKEVSSGTYFYKIETESFTRSQKMILLK